MQNLTDNDNFQTSETDLAAFLVTIGGKLLHIDKTGKRYTFFFELTPEQMVDIPHYRDGTRQASILITLMNYINLIKQVKDRDPIGVVRND